MQGGWQRLSYSRSRIRFNQSNQGPNSSLESSTSREQARVCVIMPQGDQASIEVISSTSLFVLLKPVYYLILMYVICVRMLCITTW